MDKFIPNTISQLLLISKIPRDGKLSVKNGDLNIYQPSFFNWASRAFSGDGKEATIVFLKEFYMNVQKNMREFIKQNKRESDPTSKEVMEENLYAIISNLYLSRNGIDNLSGTYRSYIKITSDLEFIDKHVIIPTIKFYLNSDEKYPDTEIMAKIISDPKITGKRELANDKNLIKLVDE